MTLAKLKNILVVNVVGAFRLRIEFDDRTGMVYDTSRIIAKYNISILALEVLPRNVKMKK